MTGRRLTGLLLTIAGAASVTVCLGARPLAGTGAVRTGAGRIGIWLVGSLAGAGLGLAATSGLIGALR